MTSACSIVRSRESGACASPEKENATTDTEVECRSTDQSDAERRTIEMRSEGCTDTRSETSFRERLKFCRIADVKKSPLQVGHNLKIQPWNAHAWTTFPQENLQMNPETVPNSGAVGGFPVPKLVVGYSIGKAVSVLGVPRRRLSRDEYARLVRRQLAQQQIAAVEEIRAVLRANPGWKLKRVGRKNGKTCWAFEKRPASGNKKGDQEQETHSASETETDERTTSSQSWVATERR